MTYLLLTKYLPALSTKWHNRYTNYIPLSYFLPDNVLFPLISKWESFLDSNIRVFPRFLFLSSYAVCSLLVFLSGPIRLLLMAFPLYIGVCQHLERLKWLSFILQKSTLIASGTDPLYILSRFRGILWAFWIEIESNVLGENFNTSRRNSLITTLGFVYQCQQQIVFTWPLLRI